jgi:DNA-binding IclR family transcriptional regulator
MASERKNINSVVKALNVMECFSREVKELKLTEIANRLEMPKSTTSNLIYTLMDMGYLEQNSENGKFRLGAKLFMLGKIFEYHFDLIQMARPHLERLRDAFNEAVHLSIPYETEGICVDKIEGNNSMGMNSQVGKKLPLHCTASGKLFLSGMPNDKLEKTLESIDLFKRTTHTITDVKLLRSAIEEIREKGYSLAVEEGEVGLTSMAAPIYNYNGEMIASISIAGPTVRLSEDSRTAIIAEMLNVSKMISAKLGYRI